MSSTVCRVCHSHAINPGHHGRPDASERVDHDLCDVCFYRTRFEAKRASVDTLIDKLVEASKNCPTKTVEMLDWDYLPKTEEGWFSLLERLDSERPS